MEVHKLRSITQRPFSVLADCGKIYEFLLEIYERDWKNGIPAMSLKRAFFT